MERNVQVQVQQSPTIIVRRSASIEQVEQNNECYYEEIKVEKYYEYGSKLLTDEDNEHEFKDVRKCDKATKRIVEFASKYINAFLNTNGGTLYIGIEDDGSVRGVILNREQRDDIRKHLDSSIDLFWPCVDSRLISMAFVPVVTAEDNVQKILDLETPQKKGISKPNNNTKNKKKTTRLPVKDLRIIPDLFVIEFVTKKGTEPAYMTCKHKFSAWIRRNGGVAAMSMSMFLSRCKIAISENESISSANYFSKPKEIQDNNNNNNNNENNIIKGNSVMPIENSPDLAFNVHRVPRDYVDRTEVNELCKQLDALDSPRFTKVLSVYGPGGVGKTTLSRKIASEMMVDYPDGQFCIALKGSSQSPVSVYDAMSFTIRAFHPNLQLPTSSIEIEGYYISCFAKKKSILLIDDAESKDQVIPLIPHSNTLVIITSRRDLLLQSEIGSVISHRLGRLSQALSIRMLHQIIRVNSPSASQLNSLSEEDAKALAQLSGGWPLALRVLGSVLCKHPNIKPDSIIQRLQQNETAILELENNCIEACISTSLEIIKSETVKLLFFCVSLFVSSFDENVVSFVFEKPIMETQELLSMLILNNLLEFNTVIWRYYLHDTVRLFATLYYNQKKGCSKEIVDLSPDQVIHWKTRFIDYYLNLMNEISVTYSTSISSALTKFDTETDNIFTALNFVLELRLFDKGIAFILCGSKIFNERPNLFYTKFYSALVDYCDLITEKIARNEINDNEYIMNHFTNSGFILNELGSMYRFLGKYNEAKVCFLKSLDIKGSQYSLRESDPKVDVKVKEIHAHSYKYLGQLFLDLSQYPLAIEYLNLSKNTFKEIGNDNSILTIMKELSNCYRCMGDYDQSIDLATQAMESYKELGNSLQIASCLEIIGETELFLGHFNKSFDMVQKALAIKRGIVGKDHLECGAIYNLLGKICTRMARFDLGEKMYEMAKDVRTKSLGNSHPLVANTLRNLGLLYLHQAKYSKAEALIKESLEICESTFGPVHLEVAFCLGDLSIVYSNQNQFEKCKPLLKRSLKIRKELVGENHIHISYCLNLLGNLYSKLKKYEKAEELYQRALSIRSKIFNSENYPECGRIYNNIGQIYYFRNDYVKAKEYYKKAKEIRGLVQPDHPDITSTYNGLGNLYRILKKYQKAIDYFTKSLTINEKFFGSVSENPYHPTIALNKVKLATLYVELKNYSQAEKYFLEALLCYRACIGETSKTINVAHQAHCFFKQWAEEETNLRKKISLLEKSISVYDNNTSIASTSIRKVRSKIKALETIIASNRSNYKGGGKKKNNNNNNNNHNNINNNNVETSNILLNEKDSEINVEENKNNNNENEEQKKSENIDLKDEKKIEVLQEILINNNVNNYKSINNINVITNVDNAKPNENNSPTLQKQIIIHPSVSLFQKLFARPIPIISFGVLGSIVAFFMWNNKALKYV